MTTAGGGAVALLTVPAVAEVVRRIYDRAPWQQAEPLHVERGLFEEARCEFAAVLERRGWPLPYAEIGRDNFLLRGVAIVKGD